MLTFKYVFRYIVMVASVASLCYMVSYDNLIWVAYSLGVAGVISALICILSRNNFTMSLILKGSDFEEGGIVSAVIRLEKTNFCILPFIEIQVMCGGEKVCVAGNLIFNESVDIPVSIKVNDCGLVDISAGIIAVHDFVDAVCFQSKTSHRATVAVKPLLKKRAFDINVDNDMDDNEEINLLSGTGSPGCEIRQYQDGDSLRSISYKLSAKYGRLLTRVSENTNGRLVKILVSDGAVCNAARIALAFAEFLTARGMVALVQYRDEHITVTNDELSQLRKWLAVKRFGQPRGDEFQNGREYDFVVCDTEIIKCRNTSVDNCVVYREEGNCVKESS